MYLCLVNSVRKIIHIDMDAFYASVEQLDFPELRGKAIAVGGAEARGVVATASYEARKYGVRSAMSGVQALRLCPHLIFVKPRFERYKEISMHIRAIFHDYTDLVEPLSLDEAYLDVTVNKKGNPSATLIAQEIRYRIFYETGLTASAGISVNKFVAKIASDYHKPNGQTTITEAEVQDFLDKLDVRKFYGIGKVTAEKMYMLGVFKGKDLREKSMAFLQRNFGNSGKYYYELARGIHTAEVQPFRIRKSVGAEETFAENITSEIYMEPELERLAEEVAGRLKKHRVAGRTITLKIKYSDFTVQTRSKTLSDYIDSKEALMLYSRELLYQDRLSESVRLLGISVSQLNNEPKNDPSKKPQYIQLRLEFPDW